MKSIRSHPKLALLFKLNYYTGSWIPESKDAMKNPNRPSAYETFLLIFASVSCVMMISGLVSALTEIRISLLGQPVIIFMLYAIGMTKTFLLILKREKILKIIKRLDNVIQSSFFGEQQNALVDFVCGKSYKIVIAQVVFAAISNFAIYIMFVSTIFKGFNSISQKNITLSDDDLINEKLFSFENWKAWNFIAVAMNSVWNIMLPLKSIAIDNIMLFCHFFIVQQLNLLRYTFSQQIQKGSSKTLPFVLQHKHFNDWITHFNKIKR